MMLTRLMAILLACALAGAQARAAVEVTVDPDPPRPGESFNLVFKGSGDDLGEPDFSSLEERIEILGRNRQTAVQWTNGHYDRSTTWVLNVIPKQPGTLHVPAVAFGKQRSAARDIEPLAKDAGTETAPADDLILESEIEPQKPYLQQQTLYTVRLWHRVDISNASLSDPALGSDALVKRLGKDREYQAERNGKRYEVFERRYAVFPQVSGKLTLAPAVLTAQIFRRGNSLFDPFGQSFATRRLQSSALSIDVRPVPKSFPGNTWLPAKRLTLQEEWTPDNHAARVGEPVTRTVFLWVDGLTAGQLPTIAGDPPPGMKAYPDQPQSSEQEVPGGFTAVHQEKIALVPGAAGTYTQPALELPWWNTETDRLEVAKLPATELRGLGAAPIAAPLPAPAPENQAAVAAPPPPPARGAPWHRDPWSWVALLAIAGWALTTGCLLRIRRNASRRDAVSSPPLADARTALRALQNACAGNDPLRAKAALLAWGAQVFPERAASTLGALTMCLEGERGGAVEELNEALYGRSALPWNGSRLGKAFAEPHVSNRQQAAPGRDELPPLYPLSG